MIVTEETHKPTQEYIEQTKALIDRIELICLEFTVDQGLTACCTTMKIILEKYTERTKLENITSGNIKEFMIEAVTKTINTITKEGN